MDDVRDVAALLEERPDLEGPLRAVLAVDADRDSWTFDDVPVDSGAFGELVSRGLVEEAADGDYRVADPEAVRAALDDDDESTAAGAERDGTASASVSASVPSVDRPSVSVPFVDGVGLDADVDRRVAGALAGTLALVVAFRALSLPAVYRGEHVVLSGNDPYYYRYWVERLLAGATSLSELPGAVAKGEPLMVATLWGVSSLLGGSVTTAGHVLAWYPVVSAVLTGLLVYLLAVEVTDDTRIGLAAVALLAVIPAHAMRTSLGFADHHAFDYPWLVLTAVSVVVLANAEIDRESLRSRRVVLATAGVGAGVAGQVLAWEAGPLLVAPVALYLAFRVLLDVRAGRSPTVQNLPLVAGLTLASVASLLAHAVVGWHTDQVASAPAIVLVGAVCLLAVAEGVHRLELPVSALAGIEVVGAIGGVLVFRALLPSYWGRLVEQVELLFDTRGIVEVQPLFGANTFGWLLLFGFVLVLALPYLVWGSRRAYRGDVGWLVASVYGWYFVVLSAIQLRFAGELAPFVAVFAGFGFLHLAERVDIARPPAPLRAATRTDREDGPGVSLPDRRQALAIVVLFLLIGGLGMIQVPVKTSQLTVSESDYRAAAWSAEYAETQGLEYPESYVLSDWGRNRMYNYFVSGEARSYGFARDTYRTFLASTSPDGWYADLSGRVGFVVVRGGSPEPGTIHAQLNRYGTGDDAGDGLGHYRAVYADEEGAIKVFRVVPGVTVTGTAPANGTIEVSTPVRIHGDRFTYERSVRVNRGGVYEMTVPYAGDYAVNGERVNVSERGIREGRTVERFAAPGIAYWSFDEGTGDTAYDRAGGHHVSGVDGMWTAGVDGSAVEFDAGSERPVATSTELGAEADESLTISFFVRGDLSEADATFPRVIRYSTGGDGGGYGFWARNSVSDFGLRFDDDDGTTVRNFGIEGTAFEGWTHVAAVLDRRAGELRLYRNGTLVETADASELGEVDDGGGFRVGPGPVAVDELRIYNRTLSDREIAQAAEAR